MRIAFVSANREQLPDPVLPLGILYMMSVTPATHERTLIDLCFEDEPLAALGARIDEFRPDLVAVSMRNVQNADYTDTRGILAYYDDVMRTIRARTGAPVVMGGGGFSVVPVELMARFGLDYGITGEGEQSFAELVARRAAGVTDMGGIRNLLSREARVVTAGLNRKDFLDITRNVQPDRRWVDPRYYEHSGITSIQTKRGCAMQCEYCTYPLIEGRAIRQRVGDVVAAEWEAAVTAHPSIGHVFIVDSVFNLPPHHAREVCEALIARGLRTPWTCYLNPVRFDEALAEVMAKSGCRGVEIGSDSGTDEGLLRLRKGFTTEKIRQTARICKSAGIKDCHTFILGTHGETLEDVERSLNFIEDIDPYGAILMAYKDDREAVDPELAARAGEFRARVLEAIERRAAPRKRWVVPSLGLRFNSRLFDALRNSGLKGPLWQHAPAQ
ncbi:MAG TPA: radical SAM protein [Steroidobacteraceae bacterium]|nr:radical SAM protein [Steroidobacteraceae bacterium]